MVYYVPGLEDHPEVKYTNQHEYFMLGFEVSAMSCDDELLFSPKKVEGEGI